MSIDAVSSGSAPTAWIVPKAGSGAAASPPPEAMGTFGNSTRLNSNATPAGYAGASFATNTQGFVTMSDAMLKSIDTRLQKVAEDVGVVRLQMNTVDNKVANIEGDIKKLPTWKGVGTAFATGIGVLAATLGWLATGGAKTIAKFFE